MYIRAHCAICNTSLTSVYSMKFYSCFSLSHQFQTHSRSHTPISIFEMEWGPWLLGKRGVLGKQSRRHFPEPTAVKGSSTVQQVWNKWRHSKSFKRKFSSWEIFLFISKEFSICKKYFSGAFTTLATGELFQDLVVHTMTFPQLPCVNGKVVVNATELQNSPPHGPCVM